MEESKSGMTWLGVLFSSSSCWFCWAAVWANAAAASGAAVETAAVMHRREAVTVCPTARWRSGKSLTAPAPNI